MAINNRLESRTGAAADQGEDFQELLDTIEQEEALAKEKNVELPALGAQPPVDVEDDDKPPKKPGKEGEEAPEGLPPAPKKPSKPRK
jgi:hypothetical protein